MTNKFELPSLTTLDQLTSGKVSDVYFVNSPVTVRQIGPGKEHKSARQDQRRLTDLLSSSFNLTVGDNYLHHGGEIGTTFMQVDFPQEKTFYVARKPDHQMIFDPGKPFQIVSGMCLGSSNCLAGYGASGQVYDLLERGKSEKILEKIDNIQYNNSLTVYETDTLVKLLLFMNALDQNIKTGAPLSVSFHLPIPEYLLYGVAYYQNGIMNAEQFELFTKVIKERGAGLKKMIGKRLAATIHESYIGSPLEQLVNVSPSDLSRLDLNDVLNDLSQTNELWQLLLMHEQPQTWGQLSDISYKYMYLHRAVISTGSANLLAIEHPDETQIFLGSKKIAELYSLPFQLAALYIHSHVFTHTGKPRKLFRHVPHTQQHIQELVTVATQY